jgi:hypothetical protein
MNFVFQNRYKQKINHGYLMFGLLVNFLKVNTDLVIMPKQ